MCEQTGIGVLRLHNTVASDRSDSNWLWYSSESIKGEPRSIFTIGYGGGDHDKAESEMMTTTSTTSQSF